MSGIYVFFPYKTMGMRENAEVSRRRHFFLGWASLSPLNI